MSYIIILQKTLEEIENEMLISDIIFYIIIGIIVIGIIMRSINTADEESQYINENEKISNGDVSEIKSRIDSFTHDEVLINNNWLETNWNSLSDEDKRNIVMNNKSRLSEELPEIYDIESFMKLMRNVIK
jgi:hypothetical protein